MFLGTFGSLVKAETFAQVCRSPSYTVIHLRGAGTNSASLTAIATDRDIAQSCANGMLTQGTMSAEQCIKYYQTWSQEELTIKVEANCSNPRYIIYNGGKLEVASQSCSSGGFHVAEGLRILCP